MYTKYAASSWLWLSHSPLLTPLDKYIYIYIYIADSGGHAEYPPCSTPPARHPSFPTGECRKYSAAHQKKDGHDAARYHPRWSIVNSCIRCKWQYLGRVLRLLSLIYRMWCSLWVVIRVVVMFPPFGSIVLVLGTAMLSGVTNTLTPGSGFLLDIMMPLLLLSTRMSGGPPPIL